MKKKTRVKHSKKKAGEIAKKLDDIFDLVDLLSEEDIDYLRDVKDEIQDANSSLQAVGGILTPLNQSTVKIKMGKQAMNRIDGLIMIIDAIGSNKKIKEDYVKEEMAQKNINNMFGLN